jgi:signal transduction histidine kinase
LFVLAGLSGLSIGLIPILFFQYIPPLHLTFMAAILFGYAAGGIGVAASPAIEAIWSLCILLPTGYAFGIVSPEQAMTVQILLLSFIGFLVFVANAAKNLMVDSIVIRQERDTLVTELEQKNTKLGEALVRVEESAQTRARVLAAASHDLRQPLHALSIYSAVLAANPAPATLREVGHSIDQIVRALGHLLNGLLDLSRLSVGYYTPDKRAFALDKTVQDICTEFETPAAAKQLAFIRKLQPVRIHGDQTAVGRIVRNLLDNAIKYTDRGQIHVATGIESGSAIVSISDTGKGIPVAEQSRVFEEFYQIDNPGRDRSKGVGLGLTLVQRLSELIEAELSLESEVGRGTHFRIRFPDAVLETPLVADSDANAIERVPLDDKRIYLVDDEIDILKSMSTLLKVWGVVPLTAETPSAAELLFIQNGVPDLLIVDLRLGNAEHGAQLARRMQLVYGGFPVLVMTGETSSEALRQANEQAYLMLQKPIAQEDLHAAISALLGPV